MKQSRISRREFITKATGAALAFPTILPASALGRDGKVAPSERINMGMLGVGARGLGNTRNFLGLDDVRIGAICDVNQTHLSRASQAISEQSESNDLKSYTDFRELNADPSIDAIMMALPVHWHTIPSLDAIAQGKHIYYEKPMALSLKEAQMDLLGRQMMLGKRTYFSVARDCQNTFVNPNRAGLARMIRAHLACKVRRQG